MNFDDFENLDEEEVGLSEDFGLPKTEEEKRLAENDFSKYQEKKLQEVDELIKRSFAKRESVTENKKNGEFLEHDENGLLLERATYKDGILDGEYTRYQDSSLAERKTYKNGALEGPYEIYENGKLILKTEYKNNEPDGIIYFFQDSGMIQAMGWYKEGKKNGPFILYNENGIIIKKEMYLNDLLEGINISYYGTNVVLEEGNYSNGLKDGQWKMYLETGSLYRIEQYASGVLIGRKILEQV